jgi:uncharacterized protein YpmB
MIIDAKTVIITLVIIVIAFFAGLRMVRAFALSIAQENHDANTALDQAEEEKRLKQERHADTAAASAFAKVEPLLTVPKGPAPVAPAPVAADV